MESEKEKSRESVSGLEFLVSVRGNFTFPTWVVISPESSMRTIMMKVKMSFWCGYDKALIDDQGFGFSGRTSL